MDVRSENLSQLHSFVEGIDNEVTMILQSLQWDRKSLVETAPMVTCKHDVGHRIPADTKEKHEQECFLRKEGYTKDEKLLPEPFDPKAETLIELSNEDIKLIIVEASKTDPLFKIGWGCHTAAPAQTLERLQATYTADERCALHAAVVNAVPSCHDLADLALPSTHGEQQKTTTKGRQEILAELRDTRRRRTKYRVPAKTRNYSDALRGVIRAQMEFLANPNAEYESENELKTAITFDKKATVTTTARNASASSYLTKSNTNIKNEAKPEKIEDNKTNKNKIIRRDMSKERSKRDDSRERYKRNSPRERSNRDSSETSRSRERSRKRSPRRDSSRERYKRNYPRERQRRNSSRGRDRKDEAREEYKRDSSKDRNRKDESKERYKRGSSRVRDRRVSPRPRYHENHDMNQRRYNSNDMRNKNSQWRDNSNRQQPRYRGRSNNSFQTDNQRHNNRNMRYDDRQNYRNNRDNYRYDYDGYYDDDYYGGNHSYPNNTHKNGNKRNSRHESKERESKRRKRSRSRRSCNSSSSSSNSSSRSDSRSYSRSTSSSSRSYSRSGSRSVSKSVSKNKEDKKQKREQETEIKKVDVVDRNNVEPKPKKVKKGSNAVSSWSSSSSSSTSTKSTRSSWE